MADFDETTHSAAEQGLPRQVSSIGRTHEGKRREYNEDAYLERPDMALWVVADGVGGWSRGDYASRLIVDHLDRQRLSNDAVVAGNQVAECLHQVDKHLAQVAARGEGPRMASTVVVLLLRQGKYHCVWAGDSRCYILRNGKMKRVSRDHSRVQEMVEAGLITDEQAENHPESNVITRAIGSGQPLNLETVVETAMDGDRFLLCSDGLTKHVPDGDLAPLFMLQSGRPLIETLLELTLSRGGSDNVTMVTVDLERI